MLTMFKVSQQLSAALSLPYVYICPLEAQQ